jgi:hypothetical protein
MFIAPTMRMASNSRIKTQSGAVCTQGMEEHARAESNFINLIMVSSDASLTQYYTFLWLGGGADAAAERLKWPDRVSLYNTAALRVS